MANTDRFRLLVDRLIYTERGQIACSVLFGFSLAILFRKACNGRNCKVILAPPLEHIQKTVFELEGDCYRYKPVAIQCPTSLEGVIPTDA
jgi:hypothetical protein